MGEINMEPKQVNVKPKKEFTHEEILDALNVIKQTCVCSKECAECPFYDNVCIIQGYAPQDWKINGKVCWRAFE